MSKKVLLLGAIACFVLVAQMSFAGGSSENAGPQKVTITQWAFPFAAEQEDKAMFEALMPELHKVAPNVDVNIEFFPWDGRRQRVLTAIAAQTTPDVVYLNDDMKPLFYPNLLDLNKYIKKADLADFKPGAIEGSTYKGELAFVPVLINSVARFVNLDLFQKLGYPESWINEQHTWADFVQLCEKAKQAGYYCDTMGPASDAIVDELSNYLGQAGGDYYNADMTKSTLNTPEAINAFKFIVSLWDNKYINAADIDLTEVQSQESNFVHVKTPLECPHFGLV